MESNLHLNGLLENLQSLKIVVIQIQVVKMLQMEQKGFILPPNQVLPLLKSQSLRWKMKIGISEAKLKDLDMSNDNLNEDTSDMFESLSICSSERIKSSSLGFNNLSSHFTGLFPVQYQVSSQFNRTLPDSVGQLKLLIKLDISHNSMKIKHTRCAIPDIPAFKQLDIVSVFN
ncbi:hypothetical protein C1H46_030175 [Malus baccata]|uniref:Uncharacterized protein n=1 Tax=Malus baccata TaxID=106549 RepID=A0A540LCP1_MALBA|nr:hypothetical protein C1H46_030175 [Malus baccata]